MVAEAKSEILRHEYRADLAENYICELKKRDKFILKQWKLGNWAYSNSVYWHFKDVESVRSGQLRHGPSQPCYFFFFVNQED